MSTIDALHRSEVRSSVLVVRTGIVGLALATAAIHASLGGMIFTLNAIGYTTLAMAMVLPGPFGRYRWLIRLALAGFTAATIGGWVLFGARFPLAYLDKALEIGLLVLVTFELFHLDGGPIEIGRRARRLATSLVGARGVRG